VKANLKEDDELKMLSTHLLIAILSDLEDVMNYKHIQPLRLARSHNKYTLYSGHDRNIQDFLLNILDPNYINFMYKKSFHDDGAFDFLRIPFSSFLILELHYEQDDGQFYVKILYNAEEIKENLRKADGEKVIYVKNKGFPYVQLKKMLLSRVDMRLKDLEC